MTPPTLSTHRCLLRLASLDDLPRVLDYWRSNGARYSPKLPGTLMTESYWAERTRLAYEELTQGTSCKLYVFERATGEVIGTISFTDFRRDVRHACSLGFAIDGAREGGGWMRESLQAAIGYVFEELALHRVEATYQPANTRSAALLARLGFQIEGTLREYLHIDESWHDVLLTSLLNPSWQAA